MTEPEAQSARNELVRVLIEQHGRLYSEELEIDLARNTPSTLFRWLCAALLLSARISSGLAMRAAHALTEQGWTTAQRLADTTWRERVTVLNRAGYARYDESTSRILGDTVAYMLEKYDGDLRVLRDEAGRDPEKERKLLKDFKGIGEVGADIFFREIQLVWDEVYPFADRKALAAAERLGLPATARELAAGRDRMEFARLLAALIRTDLAHDYAEIRRRAGLG